MTHSTFGRVPRIVGLIVVVAVAMMLLAATPAFADTTAADGQYSGIIGQQAGGSGPLPFTGLNLVMLVAAGGAIAATGVGLRAAARRVPRV
jgi:hypothetical protein